MMPLTYRTAPLINIGDKVVLNIKWRYSFLWFDMFIKKGTKFQVVGIKASGIYGDFYFRINYIGTHYWIYCYCLDACEKPLIEIANRGREAADALLDSCPGNLVTENGRYVLK